MFIGSVHVAPPSSDLTAKTSKLNLFAEVSEYASHVQYMISEFSILIADDGKIRK
jgi:hypothetical protein